MCYDEPLLMTVVVVVVVVSLYFNTMSLKAESFLGRV